jgi:polyhydroxyalkanoate synthesis regulator phasin
MLDVVREYVEAGLGALPKDRAKDLAQALIEQGQAGREQASRLARDLVEWSRASRERLVEMIQSEVKRQVKVIGLATKDDVEALKRRLSKLEGGTGAKASGARKKTTARRSPAKKAAARSG